MRQHNLLHFLSVMVLVGAAFSFAGCAGGRLELRSKITASLQTVQGDLEYAQLQLQETAEALNELVLVHEADLGLAYETYQDRVNKMTGAGARLVRHADGMDFRGGDYLVEPEKSATECQFPRLSEHSGTMPLELGEAFEPISGGSILVKRAYRAFEFDITKIREQLSGNLTPKGVTTLEFLFRKAQVDAESLSSALEQTLVAVQEAKTARLEASPEGFTTQ